MSDVLRRILFILASVLCATACLPAAAGQITVFAAASLKEAIDEISADFTRATGVEVAASYAGSSALARQIEFGAPADVFLSASTEWMDHLEHNNRIEPTTRFDLVGNRLVLIGPAAQTAAFEISANTNLLHMLAGGRLAMALTDAVPAGIYGKTALQRLGLWEGVAPMVAQTDNVRAALSLVSLGAAPLGIVYATDAQADQNVSLRATFPPHTHPPIIYPVALVKGAKSPQAQAFLDYLTGDAADKVFADLGFLVGAE
ncbi:molybdate ABC transporter substrate-binding protein [Roseobacter denitrificans]|nr:molybdate ABC transporter substrate-binding protein [Roseobacter denitrificans]AVL51900.1 molybdate ABC transporter substrate-binding protein [Roseobacter denitrificans]SFF81808.1 molybdate transport system substrate-binding protein [Roseobacter denitrificans OCh 114]